MGPLIKDDADKVIKRVHSDWQSYAGRERERQREREREGEKRAE